MASNFALPEKKHKIGKKIVFLGIAIVLVFLVYYFLYVYSFDTFRILQNRSLPLTENDREKGYIGKYILSIEHVYGPIMDRKKEYIPTDEMDFSSENEAMAFFLDHINTLKSQPVLKEYVKKRNITITVYVNYVGDMMVKGDKVVIFQESPPNSSSKAYLFIFRNKNKVIGFFLKKLNKEKAEKLVEWIISQ